ncbi:hypothetical protein [Sinisalibacter aestuarii]|uniref:Nucleoside diphosphate kinase regulator n=1 Tax=Sinisalibacter aestuarii TaxID=2949426 RepID=A0ABQ5LR99_9RHOB|nr:hypothetical protein [Sinisalibacter aestuarii]GKY87488.1 hypothetical protein STA1M1_13570 [Sinisalibacter aestuarii]
MSITKLARLPGGETNSTIEHHVSGADCCLIAEDRRGIERLLQNRSTRHAPNPPLLNGLLRQKLRASHDAPVPTPPDLVVAGSHVTYMISGEGSRSGTLSMGPTPVPGHILVASLLGATLIGMRRMQKAPLLRETGQTDIVVVLDVTPPPEHDAA